MKVHKLRLEQNGRHLANTFVNWPLARYVKLWVAHAPGMSGTFSRAVSDSGMHHGTCVTLMAWCMSGSLTNSFFGCRWRGKRFLHSWHMRNPQSFLSGKRPISFCWAIKYLPYTPNKKHQVLRCWKGALVLQFCQWAINYAVKKI